MSCNEPSWMKNCQFLTSCSSLCLFEDWSAVSIIAAGQVFETSCCICPCALVLLYFGQQMLHAFMCLPVLLCDSVDKWVVRHTQLLLLVDSHCGQSNSNFWLLSTQLVLVA
ncbi:TPA: hypothetical protein ACH3X1_000489 [Trebouxia sp. C0004]